MLPVYCRHFGLTQEPFSVTPDPKFLFRSDAHEEALAQLVYGINARRGFIVLTGEVGTGKTTLIRCLLDQLNGSTKTALVYHTIVRPKDLLRYVCEKFGVITVKERDRELYDYIRFLEQFLLTSYRNGYNVALIVDEAQNLTSEVLENVRLLSNFENSEHKLLQIVLVGQPELGERLNEPELRQIKQRVALRQHLRPLNLAECRKYIAQRLSLAGGSVSLLGEDALTAIHGYSAGIPRLVNILCDNGLLAAYALRRDVVEAEVIRCVAEDLQLTRVGEQSCTPSIGLQPPSSHDQTSVTVDERNASVCFTSSNGGADKYDPLVVDRDESDELNFDAARRQRDAMECGVVSRGTFETMIQALTQAMGPMARWIVQDHIAAMGESINAFPPTRFKQLVDNASEEILAHKLKARFRALMSQEIDRIDRGLKR
jgi:type II secretory pathway predicted ATPase ExeA